MLTFNIFLCLVLYLESVSAFGWKSKSEPFRGEKQLDSGHDNQRSYKSSRMELAESRNRANEMYASAMVELKRLEEEPICHRVAAQVLMSNCEGLENINQREYDLYSGRIQRHYVESLAASLAICDMERSSMHVPDACEAFRLPALIQASREGKGKFQVTPDQVGACLRGLGKDPSHWLSWTSYRDNCLLICQAARSDIEKDQSILLQKQLVQIMNRFAEDLEHDLNDIKRNMADHAQATDSYFQGVITHAEALKNKVEGAFEMISTEALDVATNLKSILTSAGDVERVMKNVVGTVLQRNAEMAAAQEQALVATSGIAQARLEDINALAGNAEASFERLAYAIDLLIPVMISVGDRQDALDKRFEILNKVVNNMTTLIQDHSESLEQASFTASGIHESLEKAAATARSWTESFTLRGSIALRVLFPFTALILGNYGLAPSLPRNIALFVGGYVVAESIIQLRKVHRWVQWIPQFQRPRSLSQLARESVIHLDTSATPLNDYVQYTEEMK